MSAIRAGGTPHLPQRAPIDSYGDGGFRFAGMSHRGSIACLPDGIWAWDVALPPSPAEAPDVLPNDWPLDAAALAPFLAQADALDVVLFGCGRQSWVVPLSVRETFRAQGVVVEAMQTGAAVRMFNIMLGERRRVGAGLIAVA